MSDTVLATRFSYELVVACERSAQSDALWLWIVDCLSKGCLSSVPFRYTKDTSSCCPLAFDIGAVSELGTALAFY